MKPPILMMGPMHPKCMSELEKDFEIHKYWEEGHPTALLAELGPHLKAVVTSAGHGCDAGVINALPALELIASFGVGYDSIAVEAAAARGVKVTNTPDVLNDAVAELAVGLMLALCRRIPQGDVFVREGKWAEGGFPLTGELRGRRVGILGLGRIGKEIAARLAPMKMEIGYHGRSKQPHVPYTYFKTLVDMARAVDWLVVIAPGSPENEGLVNEEVLEALGPGGNIVNVARGSLIDEQVMTEMLADGRLGGAALDVFQNEPFPDPRLKTLPNVVLSPHQGSATTMTREAMADLVIDNVRAHFAGKPLLSALDL